MPPPIVLLPLVITASLIALVLHWPRLRSGPAGMRLAAKVGLTTLALVALLYGLLAASQRLL